MSGFDLRTFQKNLAPSPRQAVPLQLTKTKSSLEQNRWKELDGVSSIVLKWVASGEVSEGWNPLAPPIR